MTYVLLTGRCEWIYILKNNALFSFGREYPSHSLRPEPKPIYLIYSNFTDFAIIGYVIHIDFLSYKTSLPVSYHTGIQKTGKWGKYCKNRNDKILMDFRYDLSQNSYQESDCSRISTSINAKPRIPHGAQRLNFGLLRLRETRAIFVPTAPISV